MGKLIINYLLLLACLSLGSASPILIWGTGKFFPRPALSEMSHVEFAGMLERTLRNHMIVAFLEQELTTRDFLCIDKSTNSTCFPHLSRVKGLTYYPNVDRPAAVLQSLAMPHKIQLTMVDAKDHTLPRLRCQPGKVNIVAFRKKIYSRTEILKNHDGVIKVMSQNILKRCRVVYMLMSMTEKKFKHKISHAYPQRLSRKDISAGATDDAAMGYYYGTEPVHLYYASVNIGKGKGKTEALLYNEMQVVQGESVFRVTLTSGSPSNFKPLKFDISHGDRYYKVHEFRLDDKVFAVHDIVVPMDFSYYCGKVVLKSDNYYLTFSDLQLELEELHVTQPTLRKKIKKKPAPVVRKRTRPFKFKRPWHCMGFLTPGISMGLFVAIIILSIAGCGVSWIMDLNTNDRYETYGAPTIDNNK